MKSLRLPTEFGLKSKKSKEAYRRLRVTVTPGGHHVPVPPPPPGTQGMFMYVNKVARWFACNVGMRVGTLHAKAVGSRYVACKGSRIGMYDGVRASGGAARACAERRRRVNRTRYGAQILT